MEFSRRAIWIAIKWASVPSNRLYKTAAGWICIVVSGEGEWKNLTTALGVPELASDERFRSGVARTRHDLELVAALEPIFAERSAEEWFKVLDGHGVPCEVSPQGRGMDWFDDVDARASGWVIAHPHPVYGRLEQPGDFFSFSRTAASRPGALPLVGAHTEEVLKELSFSTSEIASMRQRGVIN